MFLSQLSEIVNSVSPQGQLPLGIALMGRSTAIAQTLVQNGKADVNAYNTDVSIVGSFAMWKQNYNFPRRRDARS